MTQETVSIDIVNALRTENYNLKQRCEQYEAAYLCMQQQLKDLQRYRFGQRSEREVDSTHPQVDFLADVNVDEVKPSTDTDPQTTVTAHTRKKKKKDTSPIPRVIDIIAVPAEDKHCACGNEKQLIRYETKELFDYQPAVFRIIEQRREVVACKKGCEQSIQTAPAPAHVLPKVKATENLLSHIVVSKLHDRQPLYHLEKYGNLMGLSRETMARWMIQLVPPLQPLYNLMKDQVIAYDVASIDATTLQVLKEPGRPAERKSYVYCIRGGPPQQSVILYDYNHSAHKTFVDNWFEGFTGTVHMDADPFFETLLDDAAVCPSYCHAHVRRKFEAIKKQAKKQGLAHEMLRFYKKLYRIERQAKDEGLTPDERCKLRQAQSKPLLDEMKAWLETHYPNVLPQSPLGKAFAYTLKHWEGLCQFLDDGRLEVDNNLTEQEIKPLVIARKNFMFANSMDGAYALCLHLSLIRTALLHQLEPRAYYNHILKQTPLCKTVEDYEKLLPWNVDLQ